MAETQVKLMIDAADGNPFVVAEKIDDLYGKGIITHNEACAMLDALTIYF